MFLFFDFSRKNWLKVLIFCFSQKILAKSSYFYAKLFYFCAKIRLKNSLILIKIYRFPLVKPQIFRPLRGRGFIFVQKVLIFCFSQKILAQSSYFLFFSENFGPKFLFFSFLIHMLNPKFLKRGV